MQVCAEVDVRPAPELFRRVVLKDPLRMKALQKGVLQLCEEGATQVFRPLRNNDMIEIGDAKILFIEEKTRQS